MPSRRISRLNEQLRRELTTLLQFEVRDPRIGTVTITDVEASPDLYHAKVFFSVMGSDEERDSAAEGLRAAAGFLRTEIGRRLHIRRAPELHFTYDDTLKHAMHIEQLLKEARASSGAAMQQDDEDGATDDRDAAASNRSGPDDDAAQDD